ncbi:pentatricopeptide repeat-containing protein At2g41720 isoform X2 [Camellia sinensis]|uniref:pentatricopeptide repeat-containing protein At2g41720 isoform X2 n=1 Tax=Camellia sinensis TaxID=4442 RepID=UPI0010368415|nr:pentatricopeptide repeat-containing protein At2g41720 isoform X2 [Camellia sinensis]
MATLHQQHPHLFNTNNHSNDSLEQPFYSTTTTHNRRTSRLVRLVISKNNNDEAWKEKKLGFVDYDKGMHKVSVELSGLRKSDIPMHHRLRVQGDRFQKDWTITQVVHKVLELNQWDDIQGLLNRWVGRFARNNFPVLIRIPPSRSTYNNLINACGSSGKWREALQVCRKMTENGVGPDLVTHNIVLSAYKSGAQYLKALSYFELMKGTNIRPDTTTLNIVIHCLIKLGHYGKAIDIFNSMREKRAECHPDIVTFTSMIHLYSVSGQIENCKTVFNTMIAEGLQPNIVSYNALIGAYASHGMSEEALSVFNKIKQNGFRPDVVSYTSLLNAYGRSEQPEKAREIFDLMKRNNWKPNVVSYNALIDAYGSNGFLAKAIEVLREMEQNGMQPNIVSICTLLTACGRCGQKVKIDSILSAAEMRGIKLNTIAYNSAIGSYMNVGEYEKALKLYGSMRKKKVIPDSVTYTVLMSGCCKMSKYDEALEFLREMTDLKIPLSKEVYSSAICAYSKQGQLTEVESMFTMMKMEGCCPDVITYTTMIHAYNAVENWEKASAILLEMEMNDVQPDAIACSSLMSAFNKGCQPAKVLSLAEFMRDKDIPFNDATFFEMVSACSMLRDWRTTMDLIKMMEPSFPVISVGLLNQLLHFIGKSGKIETMMKLFYRIVATGAEITFSTYSILLKNLLAAGNWRKYVEVLQWMEDAKIQPSIAMYRDILFFAQNSGGAEYAAVIHERVESLKRKFGDQISTSKLHDSPIPIMTLTETNCEAATVTYNLSSLQQDSPCNFEKICESNFN